MPGPSKSEFDNQEFRLFNAFVGVLRVSLLECVPPAVRNDGQRAYAHWGNLFYASRVKEGVGRHLAGRARLARDRRQARAPTHLQDGARACFRVMCARRAASVVEASRNDSD